MGLNYLYVDGLNYCISGMEVASLKHGLVPDVVPSHEQHIADPRWAPSFGDLLYFAGGERSNIGRAVIFGSHLFNAGSVWNSAEESGFEVRRYTRGRYYREKQVNTGLVVEVIKDSYERTELGVDEFTIVTGSSDYVPLVQDLRGCGYKVRTMFWSTTSRELREASSEFLWLDPWVDRLMLKL